MSTHKEEFTAIASVVLENDHKRLKIRSTAYFQQEVDNLPIGDNYAVTVARSVATRSKPQLKYYFVLVRYIARHCGYTQIEAHDWIMIDKFGTKRTTINGKTHETRRSISEAAKMPKSDCMELIDYTLQLCIDLKINIPTAESLGYISNYC